jgi:thymidylate synthase
MKLLFYKGMNELDKQYKELLQNILDNGEWSNNRTGIRTKYINGAMIKVDVSKSFPLITLRKMYLKGVAAELQMFINGITDKRKFQEAGCKFWNEWANPKKVPYGHDAETYEKMKAEPDLGKVYGFQWKNFNGERNEDLTIKPNTGFDQLQYIIDTIKKDPTSRRLVCSAWNPLQMDEMSLTPCVYSWQVMCNPETKVMDICFVQRSVDTICGLGSDIASYTLLLYLLCKETGYTPGNVIAQLMNCHIYENHLEGVKELLKRESFDLPKLEITNFKSIYDWTANDYNLIDYKSGDPIKFDIAV